MAAGNVQPEQQPQAVEQTSPSSSNPDQSFNSDQKKKDLDERVALAKEKLKLIQEKKRAEDEDKQRQQEIERRKMGQELLKQKQLKDEQELKKLADQKRKEKLEDELAKKKVMERIQQDRYILFKHQLFFNPQPRGALLENLLHKADFQKNSRKRIPPKNAKFF